MSVTDETFQFEMSPLNPFALENMLFMSVTCETSQPERSPSNSIGVGEHGGHVGHSREVRHVSRRICHVMAEAPIKADPIEVHRLEPQWSIETRSRASLLPAMLVFG